MYSLHDPYDINHIQGLRNRLYKTFNEFTNILENALLPPVLKNPKKVQIKLKECDQQANYTNIIDLNSLISEIKNESKDEKLYDKKNKTNLMLRKTFQIKLIQCYKLIINTTTICSKTLEAGIYNPIQSKMKNLIQIISSLSLITGKYIYGELFKKKKKESFDLVQCCKDIRSMLDKCGYKDLENEDISKNHAYNTLQELADRAAKNKTKSNQYALTNKRLQMYNQVKPKLGSHYAQEWSKTLEISRNKDINNGHYNCKMVDETSASLKEDKKLNSDNILINHNLDNIETAVQKHPFKEYEQNNTLFYKEIDVENLTYTDEAINFQTPKIFKTTKLKTTNNVGLYIIQENIWRKFPIKNIRLSQNGCIILNIPPNDIKINYFYKRQFNQLSIVSKFQMDTLNNITESIMEDLIKEVLSKINTNAIIEKLIRMELVE